MLASVIAKAHFCWENQQRKEGTQVEWQTSAEVKRERGLQRPFDHGQNNELIRIVFFFFFWPHSGDEAGGVLNRGPDADLFPVKIVP